jgi:hypothetical protein
LKFDTSMRSTSFRTSVDRPPVYARRNKYALLVLRGPETTPHQARSRTIDCCSRRALSTEDWIAALSLRRSSSPILTNRNRCRVRESGISISAAPNRRVSRIRLSEKVSRGHPRKAGRPRTNLDEPKLLMQGDFRIPFSRWPS